MARIRKSLTHFSRKKWLLLAVLVALLAGGFYYQHNHKNNSSAAAKNPGKKTYVNLSPPTSSDKNAVDANKQNIANQQSSQSSGGRGGAAVVTPVITSTSPTNVRAYIQGVVEDGGTCTATFSQGSVSHSASSTGVANVSTTACPAISVSGVSGGTWTLVYSYRSSSSSGSVTKTVSL